MSEHTKSKTKSEPVCTCCHCQACLKADKAREEEPPLPLEDDYWLLARRPLASLVFLFPLLAIYEAGVLWTGGENPVGIRNGADVWMRALLQSAGVTFGFLLPVLVVLVLIAWHVRVRHPWRVSSETLMGMCGESVLLAFALIVAGQLQNLAFEKLGNPEIALAVQHAAPNAKTLPGGPVAAQAVSYVGAGIYEEVLFRLCLLPLCFGLFRLLRLNKTWAAILAILGTSLVFSLAHHIGPAGEAFHLFPFTFRTLAGLFFAGLFVLRGVGITVGTHAAYDLLVGLLFAPLP